MEEKRNTIQWKVSIKAPAATVYQYLSVDSFREKYWAERSIKKSDGFELHFINGMVSRCTIREDIPGRAYEIVYFDSLVRFEMSEQSGQTELTVTNLNIADHEYEDVLAGWVSVLLALKAAVQFAVDLRNHDPQRCWDQKFVDN